MGVYIKSMKMPKGRPVCIVIDVAGQARRYDLNNDKYADDKLFEAVPVPPHGKVIDADELKTAFPCGESVRTECVRATIDYAPTIIPAEE